MKDKNGTGWVMIPPEVMTASDLSLGHKVILGKIMGLLNETGYCWASNKWLGKNIGFKSATISSYITDLVNKGYIRREIVRDENNEVIERRIFVIMDRERLRSKSETSQTIVGEVSDGNKGDSLTAIGDQCIRVDNRVKSKIENKVENKKIAIQAQKTAPSSLSEIDQQADEVIDYLNKLAGTRYRHSTQSRKFIKARIREGATVEDCILIIEHRVSKWKFDPAMSEYLRPTTLFRPSHFEEYLAAAIKWVEQGRPITEEVQVQRARMRDRTLLGKAKNLSRQRQTNGAIKQVLDSMGGELFGH